MTTTETIRMATFRCVNCETDRPYGSSHEILDPFLNCVFCKSTERHVFVCSDNYNVEVTRANYENNSGDASKITSVKFTRAE